MNWYKKAKGDMDYGFTFITIPTSIENKIKKFQKDIKEEDLYIEKDKEAIQIHGKGWEFGLEDNFHVTVKWGLITDDAEEVKVAVDGLKGGKVEFLKADVFENEDYDVLILKVKSEALNKIHYKLTEEIDNEESHPEYKPHITIAYMLKGKAKEYKDMLKEVFSDFSFDFEEFYFEDTKDNETKIKL